MSKSTLTEKSNLPAKEFKDSFECGSECVHLCNQTKNEDLSKEESNKELPKALHLEGWNHLFQSLENILFITNEKGKVLKANHLFFRQLKIEDLKQLYISDLIQEPYEQKTFFSHLKNTPQKEFQVMFTTQDAPHKSLVFDLLITPLKCQHQDETSFFLVLAKDPLSTHKFTCFHQEKIQRYNQLNTLGELSSFLIHDLNNPLFVIQGFITQLEKKEALKKDLKVLNYLSAIKKATLRINETVQHFRHFSVADHETKNQLCLQHILKNACLIIESQLYFSSVQLDINLPQKCCAIHGNSKALEQAFLNLLMNAKDATEEHKDKGRISISLKKRKKDVVVSIWDNGPGISQNDIDKVMKPFFSTKKNKLGAGLFITQKVINVHQGTLILSSDKNKGTFANITLPICTTKREYCKSPEKIPVSNVD